MKFIKPSEISAKILTLLEESDERVIIVSPYIKISKWYKLILKIQSLKARNIVTEIYVRDDTNNKTTYHELDQLELEYKKIPHLHSKLYLNEKYGIITSMNLLLSSEINSLEIGYTTETRKEYKELIRFYHRHIRKGIPVHIGSIAGQNSADVQEIMHSIREGLKKSVKNPWLWLAEHALHISTDRNIYNVSISDDYLRIFTSLKVVPGADQKSSQCSSVIPKKLGDLTSMKIEVHPDPQPGILQLSGQAQHFLESTCITGILKDEADYVIESIIKYIKAIDNLVEI
ncbi:MAG: hypothetical protein ABFS10_06780 [Bacteroidota bacterium]